MEAGGLKAPTPGAPWKEEERRAPLPPGASWKEEERREKKRKEEKKGPKEEGRRAFLPFSHGPPLGKNNLPIVAVVSTHLVAILIPRRCSPVWSCTAWRWESRTAFRFRVRLP
ncbi:hypothetical protein C2845_PM07G28590 [Panicum miliaceum]|uniref:Uncharacterized protein n=1 Tax=Panicum miliaceum TaxID=4540 RepID=A0A3L6SIY8_PANMI|nr:hypothetical protein C2845_PM07G28590 [Panicum miliaceum]